MRQDRMLNEARMLAGNMTIREIIKRMRHYGCGGRPGRVELLTGIEGARPVRKIIVRDG
jgi:CBS domain-containing protein